MSDELTGDIDGLTPAERARFDLRVRMAAMLRRLEWAGIDCSPYGDGCDEACPVCGAVKSTFIGGPRPGCGQHELDCELASLLHDLGPAMESRK